MRIWPVLNIAAASASLATATAFLLIAFWSVNSPETPIVTEWEFPPAVYSDGVLTIRGGSMMVDPIAESCKFQTQMRIIGDLGQITLFDTRKPRVSRVGRFEVRDRAIEIDLDDVLDQDGELFVTHFWTCNPWQRLVSWPTVDPHPPIALVRESSEGRQ